MDASKPKFPNWFQVLCCVIPLLALLIVSVGLAMGTTIGWASMTALACLVSRVITVVTDVRPRP